MWTTFTWKLWTSCWWTLVKWRLWVYWRYSKLYVQYTSLFLFRSCCLHYIVMLVFRHCLCLMGGNKQLIAISFDFYMESQRACFWYILCFLLITIFSIISVSVGGVIVLVKLVEWRLKVFPSVTDTAILEVCRIIWVLWY